MKNHGFLFSETIDSEALMNHVRKTIQKIYSNETPEIIQKNGINVVFGSASFLDTTTISVNDTKITSDKFIIATGSKPFIPSIEGLNSISYLTNETIFELKKLPSSMIILGGGPIGIELACALNRIGVAVTVIEMQSTILAKEDHELVALLSKELIKQGVQLKTNMKAINITQHNNKISVLCSHSTGKQTFHAESLLVAVGRKPNIEGLTIEKAGVQATKKGVMVNNLLQTSAKNIYACGDVVGPYQFTHMANYQAQIATRNACIPFLKKSIDYSNIAWITFTDPELANAGMTQEQAEQFYGNTIKIYYSPFAHCDRAIIDGNEGGLAKFMCTKDGKLLGAQILGSRAGELIHEIQVGKKFKINFAKFFSVIHAYPTYSEVILNAAKKCYIDQLQNNFFVKLFKKIRR